MTQREPALRCCLCTCCAVSPPTLPAGLLFDIPVSLPFIASLPFLPSFPSLPSCPSLPFPPSCADRIEAMRREIGVASVSGGVDQVQLLELLGEGTYGKVYKGEEMCRCSFSGFVQNKK